MCVQGLIVNATSTWTTYLPVLLQRLPEEDVLSAPYRQHRHFDKLGVEPHL
nr:hypothetical protein [Mycobacterium uberis]